MAFCNDSSPRPARPEDFPESQRKSHPSRNFRRGGFGAAQYCYGNAGSPQAHADEQDADQ
jgi:hypothetical protein